MIEQSDNFRIRLFVDEDNLIKQKIVNFKANPNDSTTDFDEKCESIKTFDIPIVDLKDNDDLIFGDDIDDDL